MAGDLVAARVVVGAVSANDDDRRSSRDQSSSSSAAAAAAAAILQAGRLAARARKQSQSGGKATDAHGHVRARSFARAAPAGILFPFWRPLAYLALWPLTWPSGARKLNGARGLLGCSAARPSDWHLFAPLRALAAAASGARICRLRASGWVQAPPNRFAHFLRPLIGARSHLRAPPATTPAR